MSAAQAQPEAERLKRVYDLIMSTRTYYGDYHDRKEQMAYVATALYLTAIGGSPGRAHLRTDSRLVEGDWPMIAALYASVSTEGQAENYDAVP